jgi:hypothetical protein
MAVLSLPADYGYVVLTGETNPFHLAPTPQVCWSRVAYLVARLLATRDLWVRFQTSL